MRARSRQARREDRRGSRPRSKRGVLAVAALGLTVAAVWMLVSAGRAPVSVSDVPEAHEAATESTAQVAAPPADEAVHEEPAAAQVPIVEPLGAEVLPSIAATFIESVPAAGKRVALTFDLCEREDDVADYDEAIVDTLLERQVPATFFMGGKWAESHPEAAAFLGRQDLFEIANHSWSHKDFAKISEEEMVEEIVRAQDAIARLTGHTPRLFRFPYGTYNARALEVVGEHGMPAIQWDVVTGDPDRNVTADGIVRAVRNGVGPGSVVIMHANGRGWNTAEALPGMVDHLRSAGYEIVTVGELLR